MPFLPGKSPYFPVRGQQGGRLLSLALLFCLVMLLSALAMTGGYHEKSLFFSYARYEQVLPYTQGQDTPLSSAGPGWVEKSKGVQKEEGAH